MDEEVKLEINNGTVKVIQIQEESDYEEETDGRLINEEIIARYNKELQDSKDENTKRLTDKSEIEKQIKEEMLATQNGLENVFKEMDQLKQKELKTQEEEKGNKSCQRSLDL